MILLPLSKAGGRRRTKEITHGKATNGDSRLEPETVYQG
jgi:hypothetical protein